MLNSKEQLMSQARTSGYKPEILEKVYRLLDVFQQIMSVPFLQERLVLKGGTALNLFWERGQVYCIRFNVMEYLIQ